MPALADIGQQLKEVPVSALPPSPDLSFEKKQAKALARDCRAGKADAVERVRKQLPRLSIDTARDIALADAQFVIAREHGFDTWAALKAHIEAARPLDQQADRFLEAIGESKHAVAVRILDAHPELARFNVFTADQSHFIFKPEIVKVVEIGLKKDWNFEGIKARTNVAAFHNDFTNLQAAFSDPSNPNAAVVINAGKAEQHGLELEGQVIPLDGLEISGAYSYNYTKYLSFKGPSGENLSNTTFPNIPQNKLDINVRYYLPLDESVGSLSVWGDWSYQSHNRQQAGLGDDPLANQGSYSLYSLGIDWQNVMNSPIDASFFVNNLTDTLYRVGGLNVFVTTLGFDAAVYNPPRMFGVKLRYSFGPDAKSW